ncbi:hypothetical protein Tco_0964087 [Tanacetum coccineum]
MYKMTRLKIMVNESHLSVREKHTFINKMNLERLVDQVPGWYNTRAKKAAKTHDPLALFAHTSSSSSRSPPHYYVTLPSSVVDYDDNYQGDTFSDDEEDNHTSAMMLLSSAIMQRYSTPTNNQLHTSSNIRNQAVVQVDRVNIQSKNVGNGGSIARRSYNTQEEYAESSTVQKETGNVQRILRTS